MSKLKELQKSFLETYRGKYNDWKAVDVEIHLSDLAKDTFLEIARVFNPNYTEDLNCMPCCMNMVDYCYIQAEIDEHKSIAEPFPPAPKSRQDSEEVEEPIALQMNSQLEAEADQANGNEDTDTTSN